MLFRLSMTVLGAVIVALTFRQIFADLFHPTAQGSLSDWMARALWRAMRSNDRLLAAAGPVALICVVFSWAMLVVFGFALIYWPSFPNDFKFTGPPEYGLSSAVYFSLEALTTLGLSEIMPRPAWLRFLATFEAMIGLGLVTACVSWTVLLYPALSRMRLLALQATLFAEASQRTKVPVIAGESEYLLHDMTEKVLRTRVDLIYFPILYYFHAAHRHSSLAFALPILVKFTEEGLKNTGEGRVRLASAMLRCAIEDLTNLIGQRFLRSEYKDLDSVMAAFAADHRARHSAEH